MANPLPSPFILAGPTASGKSALATALAKMLGAHVVNADPFQAWHGLASLTAQPAPDDLAAVPHHLYDFLPPDQDRDANSFSAMATKTLYDLKSRGIPAIVVSGSGLYLSALTGGLDTTLPPPDPALRAELDATPLPVLLAELAATDPEEFSRIDRQNPRRVVRAVEICRLSGHKASALRQKRDVAANVKTSGIWLDWNAEDLKQRIAARTAALFSPALRAEMAALASIRLSRTAAQTLGLVTARAWAAGNLTLAHAQADLTTRTWQYARRQRTWFRKAANLKAFPMNHGESIEDTCRRLLATFAA